MTYVIGLTGNIGAGKSTVLEMLRALGAHTIDADAVTRQVMRRGGPAYGPIIQEFGVGILGADGEIDRAALGRRVFADASALRRLEALVHPATIAWITEEIARTDADVIVIEAIKLIESGLLARCQSLWVTTCRAELQLERLRRDRGLTTADAVRRMNGQPDAAAKVARADVLLVNEGSREDLLAVVDKEWRCLTAGAAPQSTSTVTVSEQPGRVLIAAEGEHTAAATPLPGCDRRLDCASPARLPRLLRPLIAAVESRERSPHLHVPRQTGYLQFMRGVGFQEVSDRFGESGYAVFRR